MSRCLLSTLLLRVTPIHLVTFSRAFTCTKCLRTTHYETLKVKPNASQKDIKEAYFKLSKEYHPDLHPNDPNCHNRFIQLQDAYKVLSNPLSRQDYDKTVSKRSRNPGGSYYSTATRPYGYPDFTNRDEWIKQQNERMREARYRSEYGGQRMDDPNIGFNKFYGRPHNVSQEELKRYFQGRYRYPINGGHAFGIFIVFIVCVIILETNLIREKQLDRFKELGIFDPTILREMNSSRVNPDRIEIEAERMKRLKELYGNDNNED